METENMCAKNQGISRETIVAEARSWLGTRFHHQGRAKGMGCDCAGLVIGVGRDLGLMKQYDFRAYGRLPHAGTLEKQVASQLLPINIDDAKPGDVYLMVFEKEPQHLAIATDIGLIHALALRRKVVEHGIDATWASRIRSAWRFPGITEDSI